MGLSRIARSLIACGGGAAPTPSYYDWMALEPGATRSFEPAGQAPAGSLTSGANIPQTPAAWQNTTNTHTISSHTGTVTATASGFNGRPSLRFAAGGAHGPVTAGTGSSVFANWAGGVAPRSFKILAVINPTSVAAINPEATSYNNDAIIADQNFRYGLTLGFSAAGIGGQPAGYYVCCYIFNGAFVAGYAYVGAALPANGFVCWAIYTNAGGASRIDVNCSTVDNVSIPKTGIAAMDSSTAIPFIGKEPAGFGDDDIFQGDIGQLSFAGANTASLATAAAALKAYWATA